MKKMDILNVYIHNLEQNYFIWHKKKKKFKTSHKENEKKGEFESLKVSL
jgi:hypothetical protein